MKKILILTTAAILISGCGGGAPNKAQSDLGEKPGPPPETTLPPAAENKAPTIAGTPPSSLLTNTDYLFTPMAADADNDVLTFSITNKPSWAEFDTSTGELKGQASTAASFDNIVISVTDKVDIVSLDKFSILVTENKAPTIAGTPPSSLLTNTDYLFTPMAADADNDVLTFSITNKPSWAEFDTSTGELKGQASTAASFDNIVISVTDKVDIVSLDKFSILVTENKAPTIAGIPPSSLLTNTDYLFIPMAADADSDVLTFSITNKPSWAEFDTSTGELKGQASTAASFDNIVISVSDGKSTTSLPSFNITALALLHNVSITWEAPISNENGDNIENIIGYKIMYGKESNSYSHIIEIADPRMTQATILDLERSDYYFSMKTIILNRIESESAIEYKYTY